MEFDKAKVMICIPAYNESKTIGKVIEEAKNFSDNIVVYDDGSTDNTTEIAQSMGATTIVRSRYNRGYGTAMKALFSIAKDGKAEVMITLDADGQHDPHQIPEVMRPLCEGGVDIVIGSRFLSPAETKLVPNYRKVGIGVLTKLARAVSYSSITDSQSGFRAYGRRAISEISISEDGMAAAAEILIRARDNKLVILEVPINVRYDVEDPHTHNSISHGLSVAYSLMQFISVKHPLACYGIPGIITLIIAALFLNDALSHFVETRYVSVPLILLSAAFAIIAIILLVTGAMLDAVKTILRSRQRG